MRDPNRIHPILLDLERVWQRYPDLRLGQLLLNLVDPGHDLYYLEDDKLDEKLVDLWHNEWMDYRG